MWICS
jgi:hypothetical protein